MRKEAFGIVVTLVFLLYMPSNLAAQKTLYVATDGSVLGTGEIGSPINSVQSALARGIAPGDTILIRGGTYRGQGTIRIDESGDSLAFVHIWAFPGEVPVFDFTGAQRGLDIRGDYLHIKGLLVENAEDNGVYVKQASHNIIEQVVARFNGDSGVQMEDGSAHNILLNIDSYGNYDAGNNGENADGFAIKFGVGPGNVLRGCRAWGNSDDGYDFWSRDDPGQNGVTVDGNWAFYNGYNNWSDPGFEGDSNGFKLGHGPGAHVLTRNIAWGHLANGFDVNGNTSGVVLYNNSAYLNDNANFYFDHDTNVAQAEAVLRNNLSFGDVRMDQSIVDDAFNSWNAGMPGVMEADFVSTDDTGADGPRNSDGSLPELDFLRLAPGSLLIDSGTDVGLAYAGSGPDIGAVENGLVNATSTDDQVEIPHRARFYPAYPNPFRVQTRFSFFVYEPAPVRLEIYNVLGRRIATLFDGPASAGRHEVNWHVSEQLPAGVYFARIEHAGFYKTQRVVLLK